MGENIPHVIFFETQGLEKDGLFDEGRQPNQNRGRYNHNDQQYVRACDGQNANHNHNQNHQNNNNNHNNNDNHNNNNNNNNNKQINQ